MSLENRRKHRRYVSWRPVLLELVGAGAGQKLRAILVDISFSGALVENGASLPMGQPVLIHLAQGGTPLASGVRAVVVGVAQGPGYLIRFRFLGIQTAEARGALARTIEDLRSGANLSEHVLQRPRRL
ncbi:MAG: PilZ domain-containing protein [Dehalococcoidia bacterium]|nr:PilZ domain-containing protein [Thermoflexaceae bacterium]